MCFSAQADLTAALLVAPVGVVALRWAPTKADLPIAALPMLFAVHQAIEAVVWFGLDGAVSERAMKAAIVAYLLIAQAVLPVLVPIGVRAIEPVAWRRRALLVPLVAGVVVACWMTGMLWSGTIHVHVARHALVYETDYGIGVFSAGLYLLATIGAVLLTSRPRLLLLGLVNAVGFAVAALVRYGSVTSVWCVYAALTSGVVLLHLQARRREVAATARPPRRGAPEAASA